jgi:hypothetical protein
MLEIVFLIVSTLIAYMVIRMLDNTSPMWFRLTLIVLAVLWLPVAQMLNLYTFSWQPITGTLIGFMIYISRKS